MWLDSARLRAVVERVAPWLAALVVAWPLAAYRYAASYDLPCHEEIVAAMRYRGDAAHYPAGFLVWNLGHPNQLFYFLAYPLAFVVSAHVASTLVLAASVAAIPLAAARLADHLGRSRWAAVAVAPVAIGFPYYFGFVGNVLGVALFLALLPRLDRFSAHPTPGRCAGAVASLALLYCAHESAAVVGSVAIVVLSLGRPPTIRDSTYRVLPPALAFAGILAEHVRTAAMMGPTLSSMPHVIEIATWQKNEQLPQMILGMHSPERIQVASYAFAGTLACFAFDAYRRRLRSGSRPAGLLAFVDRQRFLVLCVVLGSGYYLVPWSIYGATWINVRFLTPAVAVLAVVLAPRASAGPSLVTRAVSLVAVGAAVVLAVHASSTTSASLEELDTLVPLIAPGSAVGHVSLVEAAARTYVFSVGGAVTRVVAVRGGRAASSFLHNSTIPPLLVAPRDRWDDLEGRAAGSGLGLQPAYDLQRFRYLLVWTLSGDVPSDAITAALAPEARFVARSGGWILYESTLSVDPIDAPERVVPRSAESVADRLAQRPHTAGRLPK